MLADEPLTTNVNESRLSRIKRKPPPTDSTSFRYPMADPEDPFAPIWLLRSRAFRGADEDVDHASIQTPSMISMDVIDSWHSQNDRESRTKVGRQRARAQTVPSNPFSTLVRVPPPKPDPALLAISAASSSGFLRTRSLDIASPTFNLHPILEISLEEVTPARMSAFNLIPDPIPETTPEEIAPVITPRAAPARLKDRLNGISLPHKQKEPTRSRARSVSAPTSRPRNVSVSSISPPVSSSQISLSAFPLPPTTLPPFPTIPTLPYVLQVDPTLESLDLYPLISASSATSPTEEVVGQDAPEIQEHLTSETSPDSEAAAPELPPSPTLEAFLELGYYWGPDQTEPPPREPPRLHVHFDALQPPAHFEENAPLTEGQLRFAASLDVIAESGVRVPFGELWKHRKTIVCFIRHFWCVRSFIPGRQKYSTDGQIQVPALPGLHVFNIPECRA